MDRWAAFTRSDASWAQHDSDSTHVTGRMFSPSMATIASVSPFTMSAF
jgi:hypothetical protein